MQPIEQSPHHHISISPRISIIIPTYLRRQVVLASIQSLLRQEFDGVFEVIVVVDGSTDGTADALRRLDTPFPLTVLEQPNLGAASARNRGAQVATGEILLFLDDDMRAHPQLLAEHDRSHQAGADVVLGHIPLHPDSPRSIISTGVQSWAEERSRRLSSPGAQLTLPDLLTGQISLTKTTFQRIGGFDTMFTRAGSFGMEDIDFGYRLLLAGYTIVFNPNAISWQYYVVEPRQYLRQWRHAGRADVVFVRKHPDQAETIFPAYKLTKRINRMIWRPLAALPLFALPLMALLRWFTLRVVKHQPHDARTFKLFFAIRYMEYWRGVWEAGGIPRRRPLRVLAYHAIADLAGAPILAAYGVPPDTFRRQLIILQRRGYNFISADEFVSFLHGWAGLPRRPLLLTFDDCYEELVATVLPVLIERAIPAVAFAVSGRLGATNDWDVALGAPELRLLGAESLRTLAAHGIEIGAHSRTHRSLSRLTPDELTDEIAGSVRDLSAVGLPRPRLFAYPYGEYNHGAQQAIQAAGLLAAFTVEPGLVRSGQNPFQIPRIEILSHDLGWKLRGKIALERRWRLISNVLRRLRRRLPAR